MSFLDPLVGRLMSVVPKNTLSHVLGGLAHTRLPGVLAEKSVAWFAQRYKINMTEAEHPIQHYKSIGDLFVRNLRPGVRPIQEGIVHPVDGRISAWGQVTKGMMIQAKGIEYSIQDFLASDEWPQVFEGGLYLTYYLCPTDYHHIHLPVTGQVTQAHLIPGQLWPVNDWSVSHNKNLFARNERLVTYLQTDRGPCALVMVGATNVGKMTVEYDKTLISNQDRNPAFKVYSPGRAFEKGARLGTFHMGSTVIMIYPKDFVKLKSANPAGPVVLGQTLGN